MSKAQKITHALYTWMHTQTHTHTVHVCTHTHTHAYTRHTYAPNTHKGTKRHMLNTFYWVQWNIYDMAKKQQVYTVYTLMYTLTDIL